MPSKEQIQGARLIKSLVPEGYCGPEYSVRAKRDGSGKGIRINLFPHKNRAKNGEYEQTLLIPSTKGIHHDDAIAQLEFLINRWVEIERADVAYQNECLECDCSEDGISFVEDDMPIAPWRHHCPTPLRVILDRANVKYKDRVDFIRKKNDESFLIDGLKVKFKLSSDRLGNVYDSFEILQIKGENFYYSQGISDCYIHIYSHIPETVISSLEGLALRRVIDITCLDIGGIVIKGYEQTSSDRQKGRFKLSLGRAMSMLAPNPYGDKHERV